MGISRSVWRTSTVSRGDVRRVVSAWHVYGGVIRDGRSKDDIAYEGFAVDEVQFDEERAVFPIELLRAVARVRVKRSRRPTNNGVRRKSFPYPLSGITYCAHCERMAQDAHDPRLRSRLGGKGAARTSRDVPVYRHKRGIQCGTQRRSVHCEIYENDFGRLIQLLSVNPEAMEQMTELAIQADTTRFGDDQDLRKQK